MIRADSLAAYQAEYLAAVSSYDQSISGLSNHRPFSLFDIQYVNGLNKLQRSWRL